MCWWRFDSYEISDGFVRPRAGARLESYDPAGDAEEGAAGHGPYQSLVKLYDDLVNGSHMSEDHDDVTKEGGEAVVEWCSKHGLLGVLPHRVYSVVLTPRWAKKDPRQDWVALQHVYDRSEDDPAAFREKIHDYKIASAKNCTEGETLSNAERHRWRLREPGVVLYEPRWRVWRHEKLDDTWGLFYPDVRDVVDHEYPCLLTPEFWRAYAEPLEEFFGAASAVWESVSFLTGKPSEMLMHMALNALRPLVQPTGLVLEHPGEDVFRRVWASPSLLGWYGLRIAEDLAEHAIARRCLVCNAPFLSPAYQARYCSERCRKTSNMRAYRKRLNKNRRSRSHRR